MVSSIQSSNKKKWINYMLQRGWTSNNFCWVKEARCKSINCILMISFICNFQKRKFIHIENRSVVDGVERMEVGNDRKLSWNFLCDEICLKLNCDDCVTSRFTKKSLNCTHKMGKFCINYTLNFCITWDPLSADF